MGGDRTARVLSRLRRGHKHVGSSEAEFLSPPQRRLVVGYAFGDRFPGGRPEPGLFELEALGGGGRTGQPGEIGSRLHSAVHQPQVAAVFTDVVAQALRIDCAGGHRGLEWTGVGEGPDGSVLGDRDVLHADHRGIEGVVRSQLSTGLLDYALEPGGVDLGEHQIDGRDRAGDR